MTNNSNNTETELSLESRLSFIENYSLFCLLSKEDKHELALLIQEKKVEPNTLIVKEGEIVDSFYFIFSGTADVTRELITIEKKEHKYIVTLKPGDVIGLNERGFFSHHGFRIGNVTATTAMTLGVIDIHSLDMYLGNTNVSYPGLKNVSEKMLLMNFIKKTNLLVNLDKSSLEKLAKNFTKITIPQNTCVFKQGDHADKCYFVISGELSVIVIDQNNKDHVVGKFETSDIIGESAFFNNEKRNASIYATTDCELFVLEKMHLEFIHLNNDVKKSLINNRVKQLRPTSKNNIQIIHKNNAGNKSIKLLKNPNTHIKLQISSEQHKLWQEFDGKHTLESILKKNNIPDDDKSIRHIYKFIARLRNIDFIDVDLNFNLPTEPFITKVLKKISWIWNGDKNAS